MSGRATLAPSQLAAIEVAAPRSFWDALATEMDIEWRPFEEAREFARSLGLKGSNEWYKSERPKDIPAAPYQVYDEWVSWTDWLGNERRPFAEAREFASSLGLKTAKEWQLWAGSGNKPRDIPSQPQRYYKGWIDWQDWLGSERWCSFVEAREFARSLGLKGHTDWRKWASSDKRPANIPSNPNLAYEEWAGYGDWLGTGNIRNEAKVWRPFKKARAYVHSLGLKSWDEWRVWSKSDQRPADIPANPHLSYKEWTGHWSDWLGNTAPYRGGYRPFAEARQFSRSLELKSYEEWCVWRKSGKRPPDIPCNPHQTYREWLGYGDWLGNGRVANQFKQYRPFEEARAFVRGLGLGRYAEWCVWTKSDERPADIPASPRNVYEEWAGFGDWLGTGRSAVFRPFEEARRFARGLGLKSQREWNAWRKSNRPSDIPSSPQAHYLEFISWGDWLGTGYLNNAYRKFRPFEEARMAVQSLGLPGQAEWQAWCAAGNRPDDIPVLPSRTYRQEWKGWAHWLGNEPKRSARCTNLRPFKEARAFVRCLGLKNYSEWVVWCKSGQRPRDITTTPHRAYPEWADWHDWIGTGRRPRRTQ